MPARTGLRQASKFQLILMRLHARNTALHDDTAVQPQHIKSFFDHLSVAFRRKILILKFLFQTFNLHPCQSFRAHTPIRLDDAGKLIHRKQAFGDIRRRFHFLRYQPLPVGDNSLYIFLLHAFRH